MAQDFRYLAYGSNLVAGGLCRYVGAIADHAVGERGPYRGGTYGFRATPSAGTDRRPRSPPTRTDR